MAKKQGAYVDYYVREKKTNKERQADKMIKFNFDDMCQMPADGFTSGGFFARNRAVSDVVMTARKGRGVTHLVKSTHGFTLCGTDGKEMSYNPDVKKMCKRCLKETLHYITGEHDYIRIGDDFCEVRETLIERAIPLCIITNKNYFRNLKGLAPLNLKSCLATTLAAGDDTLSNSQEFKTDYFYSIEESLERFKIALIDSIICDGKASATIFFEIISDSNYSLEGVAKHLGLSDLELSIMQSQVRYAASMRDLDGLSLGVTLMLTGHSSIIASASLVTKKDGQRVRYDLVMPVKAIKLKTSSEMVQAIDTLFMATVEKLYREHAQWDLI